MYRLCPFQSPLSLSPLPSTLNTPSKPPPLQLYPPEIVNKGERGHTWSLAQCLAYSLSTLLFSALKVALTFILSPSSTVRYLPQLFHPQLVPLNALILQLYLCLTTSLALAHYLQLQLFRQVVSSIVLSQTSVKILRIYRSFRSCFLAIG